MSGHPEWMHNVPNPIPWARTCTPSQPENVVRFTATAPLITTHLISPPDSAQHNGSHARISHSPHFIPNSQIKRSSLSDEEEDDYEFQRPAKVCATADRVAAKLGHMNISSHTSPAGQSVELEELEEDADPEPLVHFSDVMRTVMSCDSADVMSGIVQNELDKSSKAVVLWTPNPMLPVIPIVETVDSDDSEEADDVLSVDSDGIIFEEIVDDEDSGDMEIEL